MKVVVFGAGKMGSAITTYLTEFDQVKEVLVIDPYQPSLDRCSRLVDSQKYSGFLCDHCTPEGFAQAVEKMAAADVAVAALPTREASYKLLEVAIAAKTHLVDILEEYHRRPDKDEMEGLDLPHGMGPDEYGDSLDARAKEAGITFLDGMGLAPGLTNVTVGHALRQMDDAHTAYARVGGIIAPHLKNKYPLSYTVTWSLEHVLREYMVHTDILRDGEVVRVPALVDREEFTFEEFGREEKLVCAVTPGMPSFIFTRSNLKNFAEKTIRWPGHYEGIEVLKSCGLLDLEEVKTSCGKHVAPREVALAAMSAKMQRQPGDHDACVMWNTVEGTLNGRPACIEYHMWDEVNEGDFSSMARVTAFPAACATVLVGEGKVTERGIVAPEDGIYGDTYLELIHMLGRKNIKIHETIRQVGLA